jgi:hypothetical protein
MQNIRCSSLSEERLYGNSQEYSHAIFNDRRKIQIYMDLSRGKLLGFYINYEWIQ